VIYSHERSAHRAAACRTAEIGLGMPGQERLQADCVNPVKHRQVKLMVWVYILLGPAED